MSTVLLHMPASRSAVVMFAIPSSTHVIIAENSDV